VLASSIPAEYNFEDFETVSTPVSHTAARGLSVHVDTVPDTDELLLSGTYSMCFGIFLFLRTTV
jgi:hypothetical protein